jgi:hypothetical protein
MVYGLKDELEDKKHRGTKGESGLGGKQTAKMGDNDKQHVTPSIGARHSPRADVQNTVPTFATGCFVKV